MTYLPTNCSYSELAKCVGQAESELAKCVGQVESELAKVISLKHSKLGDRDVSMSASYLDRHIYINC